MRKQDERRLQTRRGREEKRTSIIPPPPEPEPEAEPELALTGTIFPPSLFTFGFEGSRRAAASPSSSSSSSWTSSALLLKSGGPRVSFSPSCCTARRQVKRYANEGETRAHLQVPLDHAIDVGRTVLVQLRVVPWAFFCCLCQLCNKSTCVGRTEDDDGNIDRAEDSELVRLLEEAILALQTATANANHN